MGKSALDFDDIQAEENRRREAAVLAGASPRATKYEHSELKEMIGEYIKESTPEVAQKFAEYKRDTAVPGYNWNATVGQDSEAAEQQRKEFQEESKRRADLMEQAEENEYEVTDTSTGLPKAEPVLSDEERESRQKRKDALKKQREKEEKFLADQGKQTKATKKEYASKPSGVNPSPVGSGDPRSAQAANTEKK